MDVRDTAQAEALPAALPTEFSEVDILINNAGLALGTQVRHDTHLYLHGFS
jgi:3-hydroxy acid dehydrogenase/malonic semialdehyde reductase